MENHAKISELLIRHFRQELTPEDSADLESWLQQSEKNRQFFDELNNLPGLMAEVRAYQDGKQIDLEKAWARMREHGWDVQLEREAKVTQLKWWRYVAAAVIILFVSLGIYYLKKPGRALPEAPVVVKAVQTDASPTTTHATLTLDNGKTIVLDSLTSGLLATQGATKVVKDANGKLLYSAEGKAITDKLIYNTLTVPKGSDVVYMQLSDGSRVWLNAQSSIRYPVAFNEEERKVEITGEAYFEVAKLSGKKFVVSKGSMEVVVLGTKFNVNTYEDEADIKVTLLEGSVKVETETNGRRSERIIKPGQQAVLNATKIDVLDDVDLQQVMAWKEGKFVFNNTNIQLIMRQMERWYDLEPTRFEREEVKKWEFNGEISRYSNASKVLQLLEKTGSVKFKLEGKKIVVSQL
ncbi:hypothetical protein A3860_17095 [Niastella vici]|uniref:Iron dicitrate transport regulator FecR n=1 Tax=Niastella vici TaxID=1703345 RepID=A0A1V9G485_9BACT|nr:FecR family protein [Niastella vici]OQP65382.1 hypothetical protein A3860_17095 [Niastella vici]